MILMYHKVDIEAKSRCWVSIKDFERQMAELKCKKVVSLYDYDRNNPDHVVITFDGVYENVFKYAFPILKKLNYPFHLFITSDFIGKDNSFDVAEPLTSFATLEQLKEMSQNGGYLEWHTKTHKKLDSDISEDELLSELTVPNEIKELQPERFKYFAFPYGSLSHDKEKFIRERFRGAVSVWQGNKTNPYRLNRLEVHSNHSFKKDSVFFRDPLATGLISVIVPTYNVEPYIRDFFASILAQTYKNLEILIVTDAPTDASAEIAEEYAQIDSRIKVIKNEKNIGVGATLARGYGMATGDFCATMSPDDTVDMFYFENLINKYKQTRSDVICSRLLATNNNYMFSDGTDFTFFPFAAKLSSVFYFYPAMVTRKLIVENDIWNETVNQRHWEDILIRCKYAYYANHISVASNAIRFYTMRTTSLSHKPDKDQIKYKVAAEKQSKSFLQNCGIDDVEISILDGFKIKGGWDINSFFIPTKIKKNKQKHKLRFFLKNLFCSNHFQS